MKKVLIVLCLLSVAALAANPKVDIGSDNSQPTTSPYPGVIQTWALATSKACTTRTYDVASYGGFSLQIDDSVRADDDTAIVMIKIHIANRDSAPYFNCIGLTDTTIVDADTIVGATQHRKFSKIYDHTDYVKRAKFVRYIIKNTGPDSLHRISIWPLHNFDD